MTIRSAIVNAFKLLIQRISSGTLLSLLYLLADIFRKEGTGELVRTLRRSVYGPAPSQDRYSAWIDRNTPDKKSLRSLAERCRQLPYQPFFSVLLVPDPSDPSFLRKCITSMEKQIYPHWKLIIVSPQTTGVRGATFGRGLLSSSPAIKVLIGKDTEKLGSLLTGDYVCVMEGDTIAAPEALWEFAVYLNEHPEPDAVYGDEDTRDERGERTNPFFKPDWSPEYCESFPYLGGLVCYRKVVAEDAGFLSGGFQSAPGHNFSLKSTPFLGKVGHISGIISHRRPSIPTGSNNGANSGSGALDVSQSRKGLISVSGGTPGNSNHCVLTGEGPLISLIIPAGGRKTVIRGTSTDLLLNCLASIWDKTRYRNIEVIVVHDGNLDGSTAAFAQNMGCLFVAYEERVFNFSKKINLGASRARGEHFVFLNDDTEVISPQWLSLMLQYSQRPEVGAVGAKLYFEDGTIQHAGVTLNRRGFPHHIYYGMSGSLSGYFGNLITPRNCLAVTGACLMTRKDVFSEIGGFNEEMPVNYNDIDYCLKAGLAGYRIVLASEAELFHFESKSRKNSVEKGEMDRFSRLWHPRMKRDPYYNVHLEPDPPTFEIRIDP